LEARLTFVWGEARAAGLTVAQLDGPNDSSAAPRQSQGSSEVVE